MPEREEEDDQRGRLAVGYGDFEICEFHRSAQDSSRQIQRVLLT